MRIITSVSVVLGAVALLAGCTVSASANLTVSPESFAETVATALQDAVGADAPPNIDCGDEQIGLVEGDIVVCALSTDGDPDVYDTTVTITEVDGTDYSINAQVAYEPR